MTMKCPNCSADLVIVSCFTDDGLVKVQVDCLNKCIDVIAGFLKLEQDEDGDWTLE